MLFRSDNKFIGPNTTFIATIRGTPVVAKTDETGYVKLYIPKPSLEEIYLQRNEVLGQAREMEEDDTLHELNEQLVATIHGEAEKYPELLNSQNNPHQHELTPQKKEMIETAIRHIKGAHFRDRLQTDD